VAALADHWYLRHCVRERAVSTLEFQVDERGLAELPATLLPYGTAVRVVEPERLRLDLIALASEWLDHHRQKD
jgi:predicted DNA-binding transcriptional regulator YafY